MSNCWIVLRSHAIRERSTREAARVIECAEQPKNNKSILLQTKSKTQITFVTQNAYRDFYGHWNQSKHDVMFCMLIAPFQYKTHNFDIFIVIERISFMDFKSCRKWIRQNGISQRRPADEWHERKREQSHLVLQIDCPKTERNQITENTVLVCKQFNSGPLFQLVQCDAISKVKFNQKPMSINENNDEKRQCNKLVSTFQCVNFPSPTSIGGKKAGI